LQLASADLLLDISDLTRERLFAENLRDPAQKIAALHRESPVGARRAQARS